MTQPPPPSQNAEDIPHKKQVAPAATETAGKPKGKRARFLRPAGTVAAKLSQRPPSPWSISVTAAAVHKAPLSAPSPARAATAAARADKAASAASAATSATTTAAAKAAAAVESCPGIAGAENATR